MKVSRQNASLVILPHDRIAGIFSDAGYQIHKHSSHAIQRHRLEFAKIA